jgi:YVTN family beta-propeller protein
MNMKRHFSNILTATVLSALAWSCNQSDPEPEGDYVNGVFVINEGNFSQNNGAVSFFTREQNTAEENIFTKVNPGPQGGGIQGYAIGNDRGVLLVDNSAAGQDKIEIVDANTFQRLATINAPEIDNPREVVVNGNKAYVSCWGANSDYKYTTGYVAVIDLGTNKVTKKINIADGPENLVYNNGKLFVGTVSYASGNVLTVINTSSDDVAGTITTGAPATPIGIDANGKLWTAAGIKAMRIDPSSNAIEATLPIGTDATKGTSNFAFSSDRRTVFFNLTSDFGAKGEVYKFAITDTQVNVTTPLIKRVFTGLAVDPSQGLIYAGVTPSYAQSGYAVRYRADGSVVDSVKVGVAPTGFVFR